MTRPIMILVSALATALFVSASAFGDNPQSDAISDEIIVLLEPGGSIDSVLAGHPEVSLIDAIPEWRLYDLQVAAGQDVAAIAAAIEQHPDVAHAEPHRLLESPEGVQRSIPDLDAAITIDQLPTQPAMSAIHLTDAVPAWNGTDVIVAVLDTGIALDHPALAGRLLSPGADFVAGGNGTAAAQPNQVDDDGDGDIDESLHHGTFVAGLIALVTPNARILPVRVLEEDGSGSAFAVAHGIHFALIHGAHVINLSMGALEDSRAIEHAIEEADDHGVVVIAPSGNRGLNFVEYPARFTAGVAVAALDANLVRTEFSNWGPEVALSAPGEELLGPWGDGVFARWAGTSFAGPLVAGATTRLVDKYPGLTPAEIRAALMATTSPDNNPPPYAGQMGSGVLDVGALTQVLTRDRGSLEIARDVEAFTIRFSPVLGATGYDVVRGDLSALADPIRTDGWIDLGPLTCIGDNLPTADPVSLADPAVPAPGQAFFYLFRDDATDPDGGNYGTTSDADLRWPGPGDCPVSGP